MKCQSDHVTPLNIYFLKTSNKIWLSSRQKLTPSVWNLKFFILWFHSVSYPESHILPCQVHFRPFSHGYPCLYSSQALCLKCLCLCPLGKFLSCCQASAQRSPGLDYLTRIPRKLVVVSAMCPMSSRLTFFLHCPSHVTNASFLVCYPN